jgi:hypothetical protein
VEAVNALPRDLTTEERARLIGVLTLVRHGDYSMSMMAAPTADVLIGPVAKEFAERTGIAQDDASLRAIAGRFVHEQLAQWDELRRELGMEPEELIGDPLPRVDRPEHDVRWASLRVWERLASLQAAAEREAFGRATAEAQQRMLGGELRYVFVTRRE